MPSLKESFRNAGRGFALAFKRERNLRIHLTAAGVVMLCALIGGVEAWAWVCLIVCCGLVMAAELLNTAIETLCDRVQPLPDPFIRNCKDIAAAGVLVSAAIAVAVGCVVFLRPSVLWEFSRHPFETGTLALLSPFLFYIAATKRIK